MGGVGRAGVSRRLGAAHILDALVPGPNLSVNGQHQAEVLSSILAGDGIPYDGVYASTMVRTQQTALPFATTIDQPVIVLDGLQEINAGIYEGVSTRSPEMQRYVNAQTQWMLGDRVWRIPGSSDPNGYALDARIDAAIQTVYYSGDKFPVVFSHRGTITSWTMMNVKNPDVGLALKCGLTNTGVVTLTGNPTLPTKLFDDTRDFVVAVETAFYNLGESIRSGNVPAIIVSAVNGMVDIAKAAIALPVAVIDDFFGSVGAAVTGQIPVWPEWDAGPVPTGVEVGSDWDGPPAVAAVRPSSARSLRAADISTVATVDQPTRMASANGPRSKRQLSCCERGSVDSPASSQRLRGSNTPPAGAKSKRASRTAIN